MQALIDPTEWVILNEKTQEVAVDYPDITGVLAIGSLIQTFRPPSSFLEQRLPGQLGAAYDSVRNAGRRKLFPGPKSDLDVWVALKDTPESSAAEYAVSTAGISLVEELANHSVERGTRQWHNKKRAAFGGYYKRPEFYSARFAEANPQDAPWMAANFKQHLESAILENIPDFVERVNRFTSKTIPGDFLEIRAYPESVYNLRPDQIMMEGDILDREPFPQIGDDQWISPDHSSSILYSSGKSTIYPFRLDGRIVGEDMNRYILSRAERGLAQRAVGAILLKPDALDRNQVGAIKEILRSKIAKFGGKIVFEKLLSGLTYSQVVEVYPALSGEDLRDAAEYLASGPNLGIVIEGPLDEAGVMKEINEIKGPRVGDRSIERLLKGRITDGTLRDLLPVPGDESLYQDLLPTILERKTNPDVRFTKNQYVYYSRNLVHSPDNAIELRGLLNAIGYSR
ncbi:MAG: hypothetical protein EOT05_00465 [Candidatus Microsaccharimonas sossegonensis]|uniref:Uncharacterized protein n=1 Tax=Candidatus Microsaccharimonas sossegonensis TaxID=2506948 RepID=A0A4Q0AGZ0_9BACT|nr:MAG: hypothetical protein EOT05_00465 [Candidatus Microsaccharimonas sossegonensis]